MESAVPVVRQEIRQPTEISVDNAQNTAKNNAILAVFLCHSKLADLTAERSL